MPWPTRWTKERLDEVRRLAATGFTRATIAARMGESYDAIREVERYHGVTITRGKNDVLSRDALADIVRRLIAGASIASIAAITGHNPATLGSILRQRLASELRRSSFAAQVRAAIAAKQRERKRQLLIRHSDWIVKFRARHEWHPPSCHSDQPTLQYRHALLRNADKLIPRGIPDFMRDDIRQEMVLAVLQGAALTGGLAAASIRKIYHAAEFHHLSIDAPHPVTGRSWHDSLAANEEAA